eukprot:1182874-Prorocentrum_minimum.AAC.3
MSQRNARAPPRRRWRRRPAARADAAPPAAPPPTPPPRTGWRREPVPPPAGGAPPVTPPPRAPPAPPPSPAGEYATGRALRVTIPHHHMPLLQPQGSLGGTKKLLKAAHGLLRPTVTSASRLVRLGGARQPGKRTRAYSQQDPKGEQWEKAGNWTQDEKKKRVSGMWCASLLLPKQEDP